MFHIGDKVFYPLHGAGFVEAIEEKTMLDNAKQMLISELVIVKGIAKDQAALLLNSLSPLNVITCFRSP